MSEADADVIPESLVEAAWQNAADMDPEDAGPRMRSVAAKQPSLLAYVHAYLEDSREEVQHLGVYIYYIVHEMFQEQGGGSLGEVTAERLDRHIDRIESLYARQEGTNERFLERLAASELSRQPNVLRSVVEAIVEEDEDDVLRLTAEEQGLLFLVLKTVVDALDETLRDG
jgi:hypothetical protein